MRSCELVIVSYTHLLEAELLDVGVARATRR